MKKIDLACTILILIGALNWGFIGIFNLDVLDAILESVILDRFVYILISFAGLFKIIYWPSVNSTYLKNVDTIRD